MDCLGSSFIPFILGNYLCILDSLTIYIVIAKYAFYAIEGIIIPHFLDVPHAVGKKVIPA